MNRNISVYVAAMFAAIIMVFAGTAKADYPNSSGSANPAPNNGCPMLPNIRQFYCSQPGANAACCVQVNVTCTVNCPSAAPSATGTSTPTPPKPPKALRKIRERSCDGTVKPGDECLQCTQPDTVSVIARLEEQRQETEFVYTIKVTEYRECVPKAVAVTKLKAEVKELRDRFDAFVAAQANVDAAQNAEIDKIKARLDKLQEITIGNQQDIERLYATLNQVDQAFGALRRDIERLVLSKPSFSVGADLTVLGMQEAGTAIAPGLRIGFSNFFIDSRVGYYADGFVGLMYRDGLNPGNGGKGSAYHAGFETGLQLALSDDYTTVGRLGFRTDQIFRTSDPNFLGTMFMGVLGIRYNIPKTVVTIGGDLMGGGTYQLVYFSDDGLAHTNSSPFVWGANLTLGLHTF